MLNIAELGYNQHFIKFIKKQPEKLIITGRLIIAVFSIVIFWNVEVLFYLFLKSRRQKNWKYLY